MLFLGDSLDTAAVSGEIITYRNDGFELRRDNVSDYLRAEVSAGRVLLTNEPVPDTPTARELREAAYETERAVEYDGEVLTVDEANELWKRYSAEGDNAKAGEITAVIAQVKGEIRARYPEEGENEHGEACTGV